MRRTLLPLFLLLAWCGVANAASTVSGLPQATQPLGTTPDAVLLDQGTGCPTNVSPCTTKQSPSVRVGQPVQATCSSIASPFTYQQCIDTSVSPPVLKEYIGSTWRPLLTLNTGGPGLNLTATVSGTVTSTQLVNTITCNDTIDIENPGTTVDCFRVWHSFGGSSVKGVRQAIEGYAVLNGATSTTNPNRFYLGGTFTAQAETGDGGVATTLTSTANATDTSIVVASTSTIVSGTNIFILLDSDLNGSRYYSVTAGTPSGSTVPISPAIPATATSGNAVIIPRGEMQGAAGQAVSNASANYLTAMVGLEGNMTAASGTTPLVKIGINSSNNPADVAHGLYFEAAFGASTGAGGQPWNNGLLFAPYSGAFPVAMTGTIITAASGPTAGSAKYSVANGLDFSGITITNKFLNFGGGSWSGAGALVASGAVTVNGGQVIITSAVDSVLEIKSSGTGTPDFLLQTVRGAPSIFRIYDQTAAAAVLTLTTSGGVQIGAPTSGDKGVNTLSVQGAIYDNGTAPTGTAGTGYVRATSPTLVTPALGTPSAIVLTNATGLPVGTGISGLGTGVAAWLATPSSANLATAVTDETGSGALVFGTSPTIASPTLTSAIVGAPTGGNKGAGTINIQGTIWTNGTQGVATQTCTVNQALTLVFTNGLLTSGTCNS